MVGRRVTKTIFVLLPSSVKCSAAVCASLYDRPSTKTSDAHVAVDVKVSSGAVSEGVDATGLAVVGIVDLQAVGKSCKKEIPSW